VVTPLVGDVTAPEKGTDMARLPTVLIVDDDPAIRKMLVEVLSLEGYPTETAVNGREALETLAKSGPRVVLLDLLMPEVDGRGVLTRLSEFPEEREKHRIILVSAWSNLEAARDISADGTLVKPFNVNQLLNVLTAEDDVSV
jgi:CheY-like chemotaxis protein